jgi:aspartate/methionine/tyrosine aminotransferase
MRRRGLRSWDIVWRRIGMVEISEMVKRIQGSERSQRKLIFTGGAIRLDRGEPDFPTPPHIQEAAVRAMRDNFTHAGNRSRSRHFLAA